jgi:hypothetical protein
VRPRAERQVAVVCPADIEAIRLDEHLRVAIRRPQRQVKQVPLADRAPLLNVI